MRRRWIDLFEEKEKKLPTAGREIEHLHSDLHMPILNRYRGEGKSMILSCQKSPRGINPDQNPPKVGGERKVPQRLGLCPLLRMSDQLQDPNHVQSPTGGEKEKQIFIGCRRGKGNRTDRSR